MLIYHRTSLLEASTQTVVNTVNCVGVMGKGIAKEFKERDPSMFEMYKKICGEKLLKPGKLWLWRGSPSWTLNFPTKKHWRNPSKLEWIEAGLQKFVATYEQQGITEISFPRLGCGNGNLDWADVQPMMEHYLSDLSITVFIHDYTVNVGLPEHLEQLAMDVKSVAGHDLSFSSFLRSLDFLTNRSPTIEAEGNLSFQAKFDNSALTVSTSDGGWSFEEDDLRGVWLSLMNGLVTMDKAGWTANGAALPMLTLMRLLPDVRAIEIQRKGKSEPELAVELLPSVVSIENSSLSKVQLELPWR